MAENERFKDGDDDLQNQLVESIRNNRSIWNLRNLAIENLPSSFFNLLNLRSLDLSCNKLRFVPESIEKLVHLQVLDLSFNKIQSLPQEISELKELNALLLYNNEISELPSSIGRLSNLESLSLNCNRLKTIPSELGNCVKLQTLSLSHNSISSMEDVLLTLNQLKDLNLSQNKLEYLSFLPVSLENLNLSGNLLSDLSNNSGQLEQLRVLNIEANRFEQLPSEIGLLTQLSTLKLKYNRFTDSILEQLDSRDLQRYIRNLSGNRFFAFRPSVPVLLPGCNPPQAIGKGRIRRVQAAPVIDPTPIAAEGETFMTYVDESKGRTRPSTSERHRPLTPLKEITPRGVTPTSKELLTALRKLNTTDEKLKVAFASFDTDRDGSLSQEETENLVKSIINNESRNLNGNRKTVAQPHKGLDQFAHNFAVASFYIFDKDKPNSLIGFSEFCKAVKNNLELVQAFENCK